MTLEARHAIDESALETDTHSLPRTFQPHPQPERAYQASLAAGETRALRRERNPYLERCSNHNDLFRYVTIISIIIII